MSANEGLPSDVLVSDEEKFDFPPPIFFEVTTLDVEGQPWGQDVDEDALRSIKGLALSVKCRWGSNEEVVAVGVDPYEIRDLVKEVGSITDAAYWDGLVRGMELGHRLDPVVTLYFNIPTAFGRLIQEEAGPEAAQKEG